jgi:hypothetical protein
VLPVRPADRPPPRQRDGVAEVVHAPTGPDQGVGGGHKDAEYLELALDGTYAPSSRQPYVAMARDKSCNLGATQKAVLVTAAPILQTEYSCLRSS